MLGVEDGVRLLVEFWPGRTVGVLTVESGMTSNTPLLFTEHISFVLVDGDFLLTAIC